MSKKQGEPPLVVRRVVSKYESVLAENSALSSVYGHEAATAEEVYDLLHPLLGDEPVEVFGALLLNVRHRIFAYEEVARGTLTSCIVHPREVFGSALRMGAAAIIVAHNHPSGDVMPSLEDEQLTSRLIEAGKLLGVPLLDHVILGDDGDFISFRRLMPF